MPETAQPQSFHKKSGLISNKTKFVFIYFIIITSYLSGIVPASAIMSDDNTMPRQDIHTTPRYISGFSGIASNPSQIKQLAIGQAIAPQNTPAPQSPTDKDVWGVATKIDTHTYTMQVQPDTTMASPREVLSALNDYRNKHGRSALSWDDKLANFAGDRASKFEADGTLDNHAGFLDFLKNQDGFKKLGFSSIGENSSYGFRLQGVHLIEWVYAGDDEHNNNQLDSNWQYVGIGINGTATDLVFAGSRL